MYNYVITLEIPNAIHTSYALEITTGYYKFYIISSQKTKRTQKKIVVFK